MSAGGLDNFLRDVDGMEFNSATGQHCSQHQERDWDAVDAASARRLFFDAHPLRWLAVAGHGYPVGSRLSRLDPAIFLNSATKPSYGSRAMPETD